MQGYRGYTTTDIEKWDGGVVNYNFVSNGKDSLKDAAFFVDENIGYSQVYILNSSFVCIFMSAPAKAIPNTNVSLQPAIHRDYNKN